MKQNKLVSIIVLLYNSERFLKECLDSAVMQTYENIEIIVVINGNCTDNTEPIVRQYAERDSRIVPVKNYRNSIPTEGLRLGFNTMSGKYFTILEGDDYLYKDAVENLVNAVDSEDIDVVAGLITRISEDDTLIEHGSRPDFDKLNAVDFLKYAYPYWDFLTHGKLFKTSLYNQDIKLPPAFLGHDMLLTYQLVLNARLIKNLASQVHCFRKNLQSITIRQLSNN